MSQRDDIVAAAKLWMDTPYKHAGRDRFGMDCAGLIIKVGHACGLTNYDTVNYPKRPVPKDFLREMGTHLVRLPKAEAQQGSILVLRGPRHPCHTVILEIDEQERRWIIHSYAPARKVIREALTPEQWMNCVMAFDYTGLEE